MDMGMAVEVLEYLRLTAVGGCTGAGGGCWGWVAVVGGSRGCPAWLGPWQGSWQLLARRRGQPSSRDADSELSLPGPGRKTLRKGQGRARPRSRAASVSKSVSERALPG